MLQPSCLQQSSDDSSSDDSSFWDSDESDDENEEFTQEEPSTDKISALELSSAKATDVQCKWAFKVLMLPFCFAQLQPVNGISYCTLSHAEALDSIPGCGSQI